MKAYNPEDVEELMRRVRKLLVATEDLLPEYTPFCESQKSRNAKMIMGSVSDALSRLKYSAKEVTKL